MKTPQSKSWVEISESAIRGNVQAFKKHLGASVKLMTVVKSNAYGHGLIEVACIAQKAKTDWFGVDSIDEALALRKAGITNPILILGYTLDSRLAECIAADISFVAYNFETAKALSKLKTGKKKAKIHLEIETGISRQGLEGKELIKFAKVLSALPNAVIEGAFTHFANIEDTTDSSYAESQLRRFAQQLAALHGVGVVPAITHTACSAAAILFPETYFSVARVGVSMYGLWPSKETQAVAKREKRVLTLVPALTWKTVVAQVKQISSGTPVSYGLTEKVSRDSKIAVIPVGYWDGFDRGLSSMGQVLIHGARCKVIGRVCMNMCMVDVTDAGRVSPGDEVVLLGKQGKLEIAAEDIAGKLGTINYEVVTRINPVLPRIVR